MEGDGQLVKDSILKNKILKYYNPTHTRDSMKELKKSIKILKTHKKNIQISLSKHFKHTLIVKERRKERKRDENTRSSGNGNKSRIVQVLAMRR